MLLMGGVGFDLFFLLCYCFTLTDCDGEQIPKSRNQKVYTDITSKERILF